METLIIRSESSKIQAIAALLKEFNISFKIEKDEPYDPEFVKMVLERSKSAKEGNTVEYTEELRKELFGR